MSLRKELKIKITSIFLDFSLSLWLAAWIVAIILFQLDFNYPKAIDVILLVMGLVGAVSTVIFYFFEKWWEVNEK